MRSAIPVPRAQDSSWCMHHQQVLCCAWPCCGASQPQPAHSGARAGKLVAFSGPQGATRYYCGFKAKQPEDYWQYFKRRGVSAVVRLNNKVSIGNKPLTAKTGCSAVTHDACSPLPPGCMWPRKADRLLRACSCMRARASRMVASGITSCTSQTAAARQTPSCSSSCG